MFSEISWFCSKECLITCSDEKFVYGVLTMLRFRCKFDYVYFCSLERRGYAISYGGCCWISSNRHVSSQGLLQKDIRSVSVHWRFSCDPHNAIYAFKVFVVAVAKLRFWNLKTDNLGKCIERSNFSWPRTCKEGFARLSPFNVRIILKRKLVSIWTVI